VHNNYASQLGFNPLSAVLYQFNVVVKTFKKLETKTETLTVKTVGKNAY